MSFDMMRYLVYDNGVLIRKFASRIECEIYIQSGCTLTVLPKPKTISPYELAKHLGDSPF